MNEKLVQNFNINSNPLSVLTDTELEGLLQVAATIENKTPINIDVSEGTIDIQNT